MATVFRYDMLLFLRESAGGARYLYFVEFDTLTSDLPALHRYSADRRLFDDSVLGGLYRIETKHSRAIKAECDGEYDIDQGYFNMLLELKSIKYRQTEELPRFDSDNYYSFEELRSLMEYKEPLGTRAINAVLKALAHVPAFAFPPALYILMLVLLLPSSASLGAPLFAVLALPMMLFLMTTLYQLTQLFLLRRMRTRYGMLKQFALRNGGARQSLSMSPSLKRDLTIFGIASAVSLAIGVLLLLLV